MNSTTDMVFFSIESRKGGVGKTTTAISLAETLLSKDYQVLMFDMDIVGTTLDPAFIDSYADLIHEVKLNGRAVNLMSLFRDIYMMGKSIPPFAQEGEEKESSFSFSDGKCAYIGSNIYGSKGRTVPLQDPRVLYDAYHAYWLLELVKGVSRSFSIAVGKNHKTAIILDNSPGFSSIENSIHDFLTDLGPELGKVLLVSTIDPQDIEACRQSRSVVEKLFNDKVEAGEYYRSLVETGKGKKGNSLAFQSVWESLCATEGRHPVYYSTRHESSPEFVKILVNKVPRDLFEQLYSKGLLHRGDEQVVPFLNHLLFYFSNPQLRLNGISHLQVFTDSLRQYMQSGSVTSIEEDQVRYDELYRVTQQNGLGHFFSDYWAPLAPFKELLAIMKDNGILKDKSRLKVPIHKGEFVDLEKRVPDEVSVVERFVRNNLRKTAELNKELPAVVKYVSSVLNEAEEKTEVVFQSDSLRFKEVGDVFVLSFGLAAYRLHIYQQFCEILNVLISFCLVNVENVEKIDKDFISNWIVDILEGRVVDHSALPKLNKMLVDHKNARELSDALRRILESWVL